MAENKFIKSENNRKSANKGYSSAAAMAEATPKKKSMLLNVPEDMLKQFTFINKKKGLNNTTVLNMYIAEYIKTNSDLL